MATTAGNTDARRGVSRRDSLQVRLPALVALATSLGLLGLLWLAVREVSESHLQAGRERAQAAADQLGGIFERMVAQSTRPLEALASGESGPQLFARLAERHPSLKVLFMSGYTDDMIARQGGVPRDRAFVQKPFTADRLCRKVREVLDA